MGIGKDRKERAKISNFSWIYMELYIMHGYNAQKKKILFRTAILDILITAML